MNHKILFLFTIIALVTAIFTIFATVVNAECLAKKQKMIIILKNEANMDISKNKISEIPNLKIINIKYREKEWSKMVNKYDLPNMENPCKNEFTIKTSKNANINEIYSKIKAFDFVENIKYASDTENK